MQTQFHISGIHCDGCKKLIKSVAGDFSEITALEFTSEDGNGVMEHDAGFDLKRFETEVNQLGRYKITLS